MKITKQQARRFILSHQNLWPPYQLKGKPGILAFIRRVGCIQYDPLNIVGTNPQLVLQARVSGFQPEMLQELLYQDRRLLDGYDKRMSIYCTEDWPYFHRHRTYIVKRRKDRIQPVAPILPQIREAIETRGPLSSLDLDFNQIVDWSWAPTRLARAALETMYLQGELIIHHRINTRKVYDFAHRHLQDELLSSTDPNETEDQYQDWHILRRIGGVGLLWNKSSEAWGGILGLKKRERETAIDRLIKQEKVLEVQVKGVTLPLYAREMDRSKLEKIPDSDPLPRATIIAPLDNLLWARQLVEELFDFSYRWEVYKPVAERRFGYYVLPILYGDRFVARFEPGREKKTGSLLIKNWWWEPNVSPSKQIKSELQQCFTQFLRYLGTEKLQIEKNAAEKTDLDWLSRI